MYYSVKSYIQQTGCNTDYYGIYVFSSYTGCPYTPSLRKQTQEKKGI